MKNILIFTEFVLIMLNCNRGYTQVINVSDSLEMEIENIKTIIQDSLNSKIITEFSIDTKKRKYGKTIKKTYLYSSIDSSIIFSEIDEGVEIILYKYFIDKGKWAIKYKQRIGFVDAESVMTIKKTNPRPSFFSVPPKLISYSKPIYPKIAEKNNIRGKVILRIFVDEEGNVKQASIFKGIKELNAAAISAVYTYKFKPAKNKRKKVATWMLFSVDFQ